MLFGEGVIVGGGGKGEGAGAAGGCGCRRTATPAVLIRCVCSSTAVRQTVVVCEIHY